VSRPLKIEILAPRRSTVEVRAGEALSLGRAADAKLRLEAPQVSSRHASIEGLGGRWMLVDQGSRNGTLLNGSMVVAQAPCELKHGDEILIHPFRMRIDLGGAVHASTMAAMTADEGSAMVRAIEEAEIESLAGRRLRLLIDSAARMQAAPDASELATAAVEALLQGTGFGRAMVMRGGETGAEVLASVQRDGGAEAPRVSRSLIRAAAAGKPVCLEDQNLNMAESIVGAGVTAAMCIPLMVGDAVEAFVYLDSVGGARPGDDAAAFALGLGRFLAMGLGEHHRRDLAERQKELEGELAAAHGVQRRLMPEERGSFGGWRWRLHTEPGHFVAGDIVGAGDGAAGPWVFLGDVAGKGMAAGMLMASIQAHLANDLARGCPLAEAVDRVNAYVRAHRSMSEFATLMAMRLAPDGSHVEVVDAGHGFLAIVGAGGAGALVHADGGMPIGIEEAGYACTRVPVAPGQRLVIFSDGVHEQRSPAGDELGLERSVGSLVATGDVELDVEAMLGLLRAHSAGLAFKDDVSIISVSHEGLVDATRM
jgi:serine phosphatase RsbU (regulator of sigma subunit)